MLGKRMLILRVDSGGEESRKGRIIPVAVVARDYDANVVVD